MLKLIFFTAIVIGCASALPTIHHNEIPDEINDNIIYDITNGEQMTHMKNSIDNSLWCPICEFLVREGEDYLTKNSTEDEATNFLKNACHHLPKQKQEQCEDFVTNNYDKLITHIIDKESAPVVCSQLHFCNNMDVSIIDECSFCKYAAHRVEIFLNESRNMKDIKQFGEKFCDKIGHPYDDHCANIMPIYYSEIIGKLIEGSSFIETCDTMHFCHDGHSPEDHLLMDEQNEHHDDNEHHEEAMDNMHFEF